MNMEKQYIQQLLDRYMPQLRNQRYVLFSFHTYITPIHPETLRPNACFFHRHPARHAFRVERQAVSMQTNGYNLTQSYDNIMY